MKNINPVSPSMAVRYQDFYVRLSAAIIGGHMITVIGEERSTFDLMLDIDYYRGLLFSTLMALGLISYVYWLSKRLDQNYRWEQTPLSRLWRQFLLGFAAPALLDFFCAALYMSRYDIDILATSFITYDFAFVLLMLFVLNGYYVAYYFFLRWQQVEEISKNLGGSTLPNSQAQFLVSMGKNNIPVSLKDICHFYREDEANYLKTFNGERYFISLALDDIAVQLDNNFFRANRQIIINRSNLVSYKSVDNKILVELEPPFIEPVFISSKRAKGFRDWLRRAA